jgi:hypothetical protein
VTKPVAIWHEAIAADPTWAACVLDHLTNAGLELHLYYNGKYPQWKHNWVFDRIIDLEWSRVISRDFHCCVVDSAPDLDYYAILHAAGVKPPTLNFSDEYVLRHGRVFRGKKESEEPSRKGSLSGES